MTRLIVLSCLLGVAAACSNRPAVQVPAREPLTVTTTVATVRPTPQTFERGGVVRSQSVATLSSRIMAPVLATHATPGDRIRAGQALITLDGRDLDAAARRADAGVAAADQAVTAARADRAAAASGLTLATAEHGRIAMLIDRRSATPQELDAAVADLRNAEARVSAADARIAEATASLAAAREAASAAHVASSYAVISAPFDVIVTERLVDPGNLATPGVPLLRVEDTRRYRLEVAVDESYTAAIAYGTPVDVLFDPPIGPAPQHGRVAEVARSVDAGSHSFVVKVDLPPDAQLRSGMFGRARFPAPARDALTIPRSAVISQGQLATVFVASASRARLRVVSLGAGDADVEVLAGLAAGEHVVLSPPHTLQDGDPIRELPPGSTR